MAQICSFFWTRKIYNAFSFRGVASLIPRGLCTLDLRLGLCPKTLIIDSRTTLAMASKLYQVLALTKAFSATINLKGMVKTATNHNGDMPKRR